MKTKQVLCPVEITMHVLGGKWKPVILFHLKEKVRRFGELKRIIPGVTQKMLTQQLRELERDGVVSRKVYAEVPPKVEYALTKFGETLGPILKLMCKWGIEHEHIMQKKKESEGFRAA
ncbi:MAG: helix-turn-helix transcriptional regulator [Rhizobacter sp.]|nr:helix-turn-helix transcriptional regulator [Chlorobiales bacterium]